ncbi:AP-3 complex subunit delta [Mercurialis annua]|uniref:AP-3 complex subunit delta n=1 Tax=Mercurialis annua TaxID=3986 RepID=UPI00215F9467|nr:AP-3 complex subunit delta [Mercurialis annua]XP_050237183.1 AP-3 complex subunit delta [Mercurialis annua]XP_050237184.1 AP-3 complex subunit delta [Mercurialis annua]
MASSSSASLMETLFQRTSEDIIKGLRHQQTGESESSFISKVIEEIRREIKSTDLHTKSVALQKLTYLNSLHFIDMSWAAFHAVECISSPVFSHKKLGYLAISQSFNESTSVMLLITNQLRKDLKSANEFEVSLALECLSKIGTLDLCRDLTSEVFVLMSSSKLFVRKKAVGVVLRVFEKYPDAVRVCFKRLVECLDGNDSQIVSAVVGVFCELAKKDPKSYLPLAPEFYKILTDSRNNWVLIKVLKIFAKLAPLEPRLAKRVIEPICDHMRRTGAKSLMFECVRTVVTSFSDYESAVKLAVEKIHEFLVDDDQNLKYLGLHALAIVAPKHLWAALENKEVVIQSLSDSDPNVKHESLRLVMAMVSESNVVEICRVLLNYALKSDPDFCNEILGSILSKCCQNVYEIVVDFDWYVSLLGEMSRIPHCQKAEEIEKQLIDIGMRVKDVRPELVRVGRDLLIDPALLGNFFLHGILSAAAWVCGEYVEFSRNTIELVEALLQPRTSLLPPSVRTIYMQSAFKILVFCLHSYFLHKENCSDDVTSEITELPSNGECAGSSSLATHKARASSYEQDEGFNPRDSNNSYEDLSVMDVGDDHTYTLLEKKGFTYDSIVKLLSLIELAFGPLSGSSDVEVQERARNVLGFLELVKKEIFSSKETKNGDMKASIVVHLVHDAFSEELGPVAVNAQERVPIPDGLVLKENLADLDEICGDIQLSSSSLFSLGSSYGESFGASGSIPQFNEELEQSSESTSLLVEHRKRYDLYYLSSEKNETIANDYPPANDPISGINTNDDAKDLAKLADQSLGSKRKPNNAKARPVVVKLDGDVAPITLRKPEMKDAQLSDAVRDILLGNAGIPASSQSSPSKLSSKSKGKEKQNADLPESGEIIGGEKANLGNPSSRSKHRSHGKERGKKKAEDENVDERDDHEKKGKQKSKHRHGRHKTRQRAEVSSNLVAQTPVIPDFLL